MFKESYQFVNEVKARELTELKKQLKTEEDKERREEVDIIHENRKTFQIDINLVFQFSSLKGEVPDPENGEPAESRGPEPGEVC